MKKTKTSKLYSLFKETEIFSLSLSLSLSHRLYLGLFHSRPTLRLSYFRKRSLFNVCESIKGILTPPSKWSKNRKRKKEIDSFRQFWKSTRDNTIGGLLREDKGGPHQSRSSNKFVIVDCGLVSIERLKGSGEALNLQRDVPVEIRETIQKWEEETIADPSRSTIGFLLRSEISIPSARADEKAWISIVFRLTSRRRKINRADVCISHRRGPLHVFRPFSREVGLIVARDCCNLKSSFKVFSLGIFPFRHLFFSLPFLGKVNHLEEGSPSFIRIYIYTREYSNEESFSNFRLKGRFWREWLIDSQSRLYILFVKSETLVLIKKTCHIWSAHPFKYIYIYSYFSY